MTDCRDQFQPLRVLLIEDDKDDYLLVKDLLRDVGTADVHLDWVESYDAALRMIEHHRYDVCLLDFRLGEFNGLDLLKEIKARDCAAPVIILTGQGDYDVDLEAMHTGAVDYLQKDEITACVLERSIRYAMEAKHTEAALRLNEARLEALLVLTQMTEGPEHELMDYALESGIRLTSSKTGYLAFLDVDERIASTHPWSGTGMEECALPARLPGYPLQNAGLWAEAVRQRCPIITNDFAAPSPHKKGYPKGHIPLVRCVNVPVFHHGTIVAVVGVANKEEPYDDSDVRQLTLLMDGMWKALQRRRTEEQLRYNRKELQERERYYRSLLANMHEDLLVVDQDHRVRDASKDYLVSVALERKDLIGRCCHEILRGYGEPCSERGETCMIQEVLMLGLPRKFCHQYTKRDGSKIWLDVILSPVKDENGHAIQVILALRDVTHEMETETRLRQVQKLEAIGTLAGGIAHDFNNILGIIFGYAEICRFGLREDDPQYENLGQVIKAAQRAKELVSQILSFSRQKAQERRPLLLSVIIKETMRMLRAALPSTIEIRQGIDTRTGGDATLADPTEIHQVLMNLCTNAAHAMQEKGGVLDVRLSSVDFGPDDISRHPELKPGPYIRLIVSDTGHGMDPATLERIFEPYFTTKGLGEGTGLGLAVVHGIVRACDGSISVYSKPGAGTTFHLFLPRIESEGKAKDEIMTPPPMGKESILFVDDEQGLADVGRQIFEHLGYKVTVRTSSIEALEAFRANPERFDLIVTDLTMPNMTGMELAKALMRLRPSIPIILCTGFSELITEEKARAAGIQALIPKPLIVRDMAMTVRGVLDRESENS